MDSVRMRSFFHLNRRSSLLCGALCAANLLSVGCSAGGGSDPFQQSGSDAKVRAPDGRGLRNQGLGVVPSSPSGREIGDTSAIAGHWYVERDKTRWLLVVDQQAGRLIGSLAAEGDLVSTQPLENLTWDPVAGHLSFRAEEGGRSVWYAIDIADGAMTGRYAVVVGAPLRLAPWSQYSGHLTGWRSESFDGEIVPRVYDIVIDDDRFARLRIDRGSDASAFVGDLKIIATRSKGSIDELSSQQVLVRRWDGQHIAFDVTTGTVRQRFTGIVRGRLIDGTMVEDRSGVATTFAGARANILSYGSRVKAGESRSEWQERARRILFRLMMAGNPAPIATEVTISETAVLRSDQVGPERDDDSGHWRQQYRLAEVTLDHTLPNPYGAQPMTRRSHGFLSTPTTPPPPDGFGIVLVLNGHVGSARRQFQPDDYYWYGDAYARRGYIVLALDVSHRPPSETGGLYDDIPDGDHPATGNHAHPAIAAPGLDSDWAEDGERAWDAMRGIDFLLTQQQANPAKIIVTGVSLGGEVSEIVGALDPRVTTVVPASAPPDLTLMRHHGNHPCWQWTHGDVTEFVEVSDYLSLIAPRQIILETGKWDYTYSDQTTPFAVEKENAWRARVAFGDEAANFVHYLHDAGHQYRVGDSSDARPEPGYIQVPQLIAPPGVRKRSVDWEVDGATVSLDETLFGYLAR